MTSAPGRSIASRIASRVSAVCTRNSNIPPSRLTSPRSMLEFESKIWNSPRGWPGAASSFPVISRRTRGRRTTSTRLTPTDASSPTSCGRKCRPALSRHVPAEMSSLRRLTCFPGATGVVISTSPSDSIANSAGSTASTPLGRGAPVMIRTAEPEGAFPRNGWPGNDSPTT